MSTKTKIKIAVADDHTIFRESFIPTLAARGYTIIFDAENAAGVFENLKTKTPDILLLDIKMPDTRGSETLEKVKKLYPDIKVIILTATYRDDLIVECIRKGSNAFLPKTCGRDLLFKTIETVYEKGIYYEEKIAALIPKILEATASDNKHFNKDGLSEIECVVMVMLSDNFSRPQISDKLNISKRTFDRHRDDIKTKTGCRTTLDIAKYVKDNNITL